MYKMTVPQQISFDDFNQAAGVPLDPKNEWCILADLIPWSRLEGKYAEQFPGTRGHVALPFRMAFGALIIQARTQLSDRKTVQEIAQNPYHQYFIGLPKFQTEAPFTAPLMVSFRKRMNAAFIGECNDIIIEVLDEARRKAAEQAPKKRGRKKKPAEDMIPDENGNVGTVILDATCAPSNIKYPQDYVLLNDAREQLEQIIDWFCKTYDLPKPRTYRRVAREDYLALAKRRRRDQKMIRATVRKMLGYVRRDIGYIERYLSDGYEMWDKKVDMYETIKALYDQQYYMWKNHTHRVENRIVSIYQPWIRPIVRGKAKTPTEFGAKFEVEIDEKGYGRMAKSSFDPYNESATLIEALERYKSRTGHYPKRVLVDQIYRTRQNRDFCKRNGIRMSGPKLGRPAKDKEKSEAEKKIEYQDNVDRIEVERFFSTGKRSNGMGLIMTRLEETALTSIALSILSANLFTNTPQFSFFTLFMQCCESEESSPQIGYVIFLEEDDACEYGFEVEEIV